SGFGAGSAGLRRFSRKRPSVCGPGAYGARCAGRVRPTCRGIDAAGCQEAPSTCVPEGPSSTHSRSPGPPSGSSRDAAAGLLRREELRRLRVLDRRVLATPRPYRGPDGERRQLTAVTSAGAGWPGPSGAPAELNHVLGEALV